VRRRLLVLVGSTTSLVLVAFLVPLALLLHSVAADRAVQTATVEAQAMSSLTATADRAALALSVQQVNTTSPFQVTLFLADGTTIGAAVDRTPLVELGLRGASASADVAGGREVVFSLRDRSGRGAAIRTFVPDAELTRGVARSWLLLATLGLGLLLLSLAVADRLARSLVRSSIDLAAVSHRLSRGELDARADPAGPGELGVVAAALNMLAARITELIREERETVADLAHRVRTPLTALRLEAESLRDARDASRIGHGVEEVERAVTGAIAAARRRAAEAGAGSGDTDAAAVLAERIDFWAVLAEDTDRHIDADLAPGPLRVGLTRGELEAGVDAILGNVFTHTPDRTPFAVRLTARPEGGATLTVVDAGPGLPTGSSVVQRGISGAGSTGLGLDIVRRTAERAGGTLRLVSSGRRGLTVVVELGPPVGIAEL
jgi:signal transduction histidine kinase